MSEIHENPYAPGVVQKKHIHTDVEAVRHKHLSHEASVKSIGLLYLIGGGIGLLAGSSYLFTGIGMMINPGRPGQESLGAMGVGFLVLGIFALVMSLAQIVVAVGFRRLSLWSKIPGAIVAGIGLIFFPVGTLINGYVLYLLFSKKGTMVFSPEYKEVVLQTPYMKYKTSIVVWVFVGILAMLFIVAIGAAIFA